MNYLATRRMHPGGEHYFDAMQAIMLKSFKENLAGDWEFKFLTGHFPTKQYMFRDTILDIHKLWQEGHSVFCVDADVICQKPTEVFGKYKDMMMFWDTPAKYKAPRRFLNAGVVYFPSTMEQKTWEVGLDMLPEFDVGATNWDQYIFNDMFWSQAKTSRDLDPSMNWNRFVPNPMRELDAKIVHFHASRGLQKMLERMESAAGVAA